MASASRVSSLKLFVRMKYLCISFCNLSIQHVLRAQRAVSCASLVCRMKKFFCKTVVFRQKNSNLPKLTLSSKLTQNAFSVAGQDVQRKTIFEYHRLSMKDERITNKTAILFQSLPTCNTNPDCGSCLANSNFDLECRWCQGDVLLTIDQSESFTLTFYQSQASAAARMARTGTGRAG